MSKVLKTIGKIATVVAAVALIGSGIGSVLGGTMMFTAFGASIAAGTIATVAGAIAAGASLLMKKPGGLPQETTNRLFGTFDPQAARKIVFGQTAMATDIRYQAYTGANQDYLHWIIACASHKVESIDEIWFDDYMAWSKTGGVISRLSYFLSVSTREEGRSDSAILVDSAWNSSATLTGCAHLHIRYRLSEKDKKTPSPFASSVPTRITIKGKGMPLPDIRNPATDADYQPSWNYDSRDNPALQLLAYLIGWRINGKLAVGKGIPVNRIDLDSFITAANMCDEEVALAGGGTEPRYRSAGVFSESDSPSTVVSNLLASMNAVLRDSSGKLALTVLHNDLAVPVAHFTEDDILGEERWSQTMPLDSTFNIVRGRCVDPSNFALYQLKDYPEVSIDSPDEIDRIDTFDLPLVQSTGQAQRLAKQRLQRQLYSGSYSVTVNARGWQVSLGDVVTFSHAYLGWDEKLFRVAAHGVSVSGQVPMVLVEEHADIYQWDAEESPAVEAAEPTGYDPLLHPWAQAFQRPAGVGAQLLADDTFASGYWALPAPAEQIAWSESRSAYAVSIPFVELTDLRVTYDAPSDLMPRTQPGKPIFIRVEVDPEGVGDPVPLEIGGEAVTIGFEPVEFPSLSSADFPLEIGIDWLDINGNFVSRSTIATADPADGAQAVTGSATAPVRGYAALSIGFASQTGATGAWTAFEPWLAEYEPSADVTGESVPDMVVAPTVTITTDYTGAPTSVFPIYLGNTRKLGNADVSADSEWTATFPPGMTATINNTPDSPSRGLITITGWSGTGSSTITVQSTRNGLTKEGSIAVAVAVGSPPSGGSTGGGGSAGSTASDSSITNASSTSYGSANAGPLTVNSGSSGVVTLTAPFNFEANVDGEYYSAYGKWQWRAVGGTWADVGTETVCDIDSFRGYDEETRRAVNYKGYLALNTSKTGLTPDTDYEFQVLLRSGSVGVSLSFTGTATASGS